MENVSKLMHMAFAAIVFCISIACLFYEAKTYRDTLNTVREMIKDDKVLYIQNNQEDAEKVSYAQLIATLMQPLEYDIVVDGRLISRSSHTAYQISGYGIIKRDHIKSYHYDAHGNIDRVVYTSIG